MSSNVELGKASIETIIQKATNAYSMLIRIINVES